MTSRFRPTALAEREFGINVSSMIYSATPHFGPTAAVWLPRCGRLPLSSFECFDSSLFL